MDLLTLVVRRRRHAWLAIAIAVGLAALVFVAPSPQPAAPVSSTGLPATVQSVQVERLQRELPSARVAPAVVVLSRSDGAALTQADQAAVAKRATQLRSLAAGGQVAPAQYSPNRSVALIAVPLATVDDAAVTKSVGQLRAELTGLPDGLRAQVTGAPAFTADLTAVFDGADVTLLLATLSVVALLLLLTYRSPILWVVPLVVVAGAEQVTLRLADLIVPRLGIPLDAAVTGIVSVLVFGAATDYALLLIARYREELRRSEDRFTAMGTALRRTATTILASGGTVMLAVLTLLLSTLSGNRALAVSAAIGVAVAVVSALVVLPALLVVCGRGVFWPFVPRFGSAAREGRVWGRLGVAVERRPRFVVAGAVVALALLATGALGIRVGLSETEQFRVKPEAVLGAQTLATQFPAGTTQPVAVMTTPEAAQPVISAAKTVQGVASATLGESTSRIAQVDVVLTPEPGTAASDSAIRAVRSVVADVPGANAAVGGPVAATLDVKEANSRDLRLIVPLILALVALVLVALLRSLVAPVLLVLTVIASFLASIGASWLLFDRVLGFPALDSGVPLLAFVFLVALGVDYNIFLVTRAREDAATAGTRDGMLNALRVTGGVITSAGVLLAAVFAVLGVLPLVTLTQIGVIVCVGVLLDTLLVRTVLVPALAFILGDRFWWPGRPTPQDPGTSTAKVTGDVVRRA